MDFAASKVESLMKLIALSAMTLIAIVAATAPSSAAVVFAPARCPDLVEDRLDRRESRRDERIDWSRRDVREDRADRRESRRDRQVAVCPAASFVHFR